MKIKDIKRDKSNYKEIKVEADIDEIIESPLRRPIKELYRKNIITIMSSANEINVQWLDNSGNNMYQSKLDFDATKFSYGDGYAYIILDYDSLSDINKRTLDKLYDELNLPEEKQAYEKPITAEQSYNGNKRIIYAIHQIENPVHTWEIDSERTYELLTKKMEDTSDIDFMQKSNFVYTTPYTERSVIVRYPVNENTDEKEVEDYFNSIFSRLESQEKRITIEEIIQKEAQFSDRDKSSLDGIARDFFAEQNRRIPYQPYTKHIFITEREKKEIIARYIKRNRDFEIELLKTKINKDMTDEEKYRVIFDYFVNRYKYDYSILDAQKAFEHSKKAFSLYRNILKSYISNITNYNNMNCFEQIQALVEQIPTDEAHKELLDLMKSAEMYYAKSNEFKNNSRNYRYGNLYITRYGVCQDFANAFKEFCDEFELPCETIEGHIMSGDANVGHAWNAIVIDNEIRFIDISSAIHSKDGTYLDTRAEDFFNVNEQELEAIDNGKNRTLTEESKEKLLEMKKATHPFNPNGDGIMTNQNNDTER